MESDVYAAREVLDGDFDLVFTGIGALCWLPSVERWAQTVASLLRPGGRLFIREGHPVLWALGEDGSHLELTFPYFEVPAPMVWDDDSTYVETETRFTNTVTHEWNHGIGQLLTAVMEAGLSIDTFVEHDSVPWEAFPGHMETLPNGEHRILDRPERLPHSYTLVATRR